MVAYLSVCSICLGSPTYDIRRRFATNDLPSFVVAELASQGVA
jgi:hypothetical protein